MVEIRVQYQDGLHCEAVHGPSERRLTTDAPLDNQGRGESFSPTDLVATALGTCILTVMGIAAERHGWQLEGATARVEKHMVSDPRRRIGRLEVVVEVPGAPGTWGERARAILERAGRGCPVQGSLHPDVEVPVRFQWGSA